MKKKGQGISINVIIVAALALLVLVLLALIFTGRITLFGRETISCETNGGTCQTACDPDIQIERAGYSCADEAEVCCFGAS